MHKLLFFIGIIVTNTLFSQSNTRTQITGRIVDVKTGEGIKQARIQLINHNVLAISDDFGKFKFTDKEKIFRTGEKIYSFLVTKNGYKKSEYSKIAIQNNGAIGDNFELQPNTDDFLWISVIKEGGGSNKLLKDVSVNIRGEIQITDEHGQAKFDLSILNLERVEVSFKKKCFDDKLEQLNSTGFYKIYLTPNNCKDNSNTINIHNNLEILKKAQDDGNGSKIGQATSLEFLLEQKLEFNNSNFSGVNLSEAKINNGNFKETLFNGSDLSYVNAKKVDFSGTKLKFANLTNAIFTQAKFQKTFAPFIVAKGVDFSGSDLSGANFFSADLRNADFRGAKLIGTCFAYADLRGAKFDGANLKKAYLSGAILDGSTFHKSEIDCTEFLNSTGVDFEFTESQFKGICRHPTSNSKRSKYSISLTYKKKSNDRDYLFSYDNILDEHIYLFGFEDKSWNLCNCNSDNAIHYKATGYYSGYLSLRLDENYAKHGNRLSSYKERVIKHIEKLKTFNTKKRQFIGRFVELKKWISDVNNSGHNIRPINKLYLNSDLILLHLLNNNIYDIESVDWSEMASKRYYFEKKIAEDSLMNLKSYSAWGALYPSSIYGFWNEIPKDVKAEVYRNWTIKRISKFSSKKIFIRSKISELLKSKTSISKLNIQDIVGINEIENRRTSFKTMPLSVNGYIIANPKTTIAIPAYSHKYFNGTSRFLFPENTKSIELPIPKQLQYGKGYVEIELSLEKIEIVDTYEMFLVIPISISFYDQSNKLVNEVSLDLNTPHIKKFIQSIKQWEKIKGNPTEKDLKKIIFSDPLPLYSSLAKIKMDSINNRIAWEQVMASGSVRKLEKYLKEYRSIDKSHFKEANAIIDSRKSLNNWFKIPNRFKDSLIDIDGNRYPTKKMDDGKTWLLENLNLKIYGSECPYGRDDYCQEYGRIYTYEAAISACKKLGRGWKLPSEREYRNLLNAYRWHTTSKRSPYLFRSNKYKDLAMQAAKTALGEFLLEFNFSGAGKGYESGNNRLKSFTSIYNAEYWTETKTNDDSNNKSIFLFELGDNMGGFISILKKEIAGYKSCRCIKTN